ncbi:MAG: hypothetical protein V2B18_00615 [Pseudomonadota bacterium]
MIFTLTDGTLVDCDDRPIGGGAAGTTYATRDGRSVVKIFKDPSNDMKRVLEDVIGPYNCVGKDPYWQALMSWPDGIVTKPSLGVRMLRAPRDMDKLTWVIFPKLYNNLPAEKKDWFKRLTMALRLARATARMHRSGVAHSDLSPNNIMADPVRGTINLIDLDGLVVPGFVPPQVLGTPDYIAPEVLAGKAQPSTRTDRHALAVLLHQLLLYRHPFRGPKRFSPDPDEDERLCLGESAVFINHPTDRSNRPHKGFWSTNILGSTIDGLFVKAFVTGVKDPDGRPGASEWESALARLADRVVGCGGRGCEDRYFPVTDGMPIACPWCGTPFVVPGGIPALRLYTGDRHGNFHPEADYWIAGYPGKTLHSWHVTKGVTPGPSADPKPWARIDLDKGKWYLHNMGLHDARLIQDGTIGKNIALKESVQLVDGLALLLGPLPDCRMVYVQWIS